MCVCVSLSSFLCKSLGSISDAQASVSSFTVEAVPMGKGRSIETNQPPMKSPLRALDEHVCVCLCVSRCFADNLGTQRETQSCLCFLIGKPNEASW